MNIKCSLFLYTLYTYTVHATKFNSFSFNGPIFIKFDCYIASAETKRDWLIRGHLTLDKFNVSLGQQVKNVARQRT